MNSYLVKCHCILTIGDCETGSSNIEGLCSIFYSHRLFHTKFAEAVMFSCFKLQSCHWCIFKLAWVYRTSFNPCISVGFVHNSFRVVYWSVILVFVTSLSCNSMVASVGAGKLPW